MSEVSLNEREQLIESILRMPNDQVKAYGKLLNAFISHAATLSRIDYLELLIRIIEETDLALDDDLEDQLDHAIIQARKGEPGRPFEDFVKELGFTQEEIAAAMRSEGLDE